VARNLPEVRYAAPRFSRHSVKALLGEHQMGLDAVEFVMAVEDAFGISIPSHEAEQLATPRALAEYVEHRLPSGSSAACHTQRAFYKLRSGIVQAHRIPRGNICPDTSWQDILPSRSFGKAWRHMQKVTGMGDWPRASFLGFRTPAARTVGGTATYLATRAPAALKHAGEGWTRAEIDQVIVRLMAHELGITAFSWNDRFAEELRVD
jgi:hypothetical protein